MMRKWLALLCLLALPVFAAERYAFESPEQRAQFQGLIHGVRCLVCQNQSLAESSAPFAEDLKSEIYAAVQSGQSDALIKSTLVARYGDAILFEPPWTAHYYALWLAPVVLSLLIGYGLVRYLCKQGGSA